MTCSDMQQTTGLPFYYVIAYSHKILLKQDISIVSDSLNTDNLKIATAKTTQQATDPQPYLAIADSSVGKTHKHNATSILHNSDILKVVIGRICNELQVCNCSML